jgi:hypothetical protein
VLAEVTQLISADEVTRRLRDQYLTAMTGGRDPRRSVNVDAHISLLGEQRLARVQTHTDGELARAQSLLRVRRSFERILRPPEGDEKRIALGVHLYAAVLRERVSQQAPVLLE